MSKIKDLYAETEGIDDLMPPQSEKDRLKKILLAQAKRFMGLEDWLYARAEWGIGYDDNLHYYFYVKNMEQMADTAATDLVEGYIEDEHYDMSDELYSELIDWLGDELIKDWEPVERTLVNRKVEDDKESWERYKEYNHITTGRGYGWGY